MKCIIKIDDNGNANGHPFLLSNFIDAFPNLDISGDIAPDGYVWFTRKNPASANLNPNLTQTIDIRYVKTNDGYEDEFYIRDLNDDEFEVLIKEIQSNPPLGFKSWNLDINSNTYFWIPPISKPGMNFKWDETSISWIECTNDEPITSSKIPSRLTSLPPLP